MANPQPDVFLRVSRELSNAFARTHLSGNEWQILWHILNQTYGWGKKSDAISLSQFERATELSHASVCEALRKLVVKKVLVVVGKRGLVTDYGLNKNYEEWDISQIKGQQGGREKGTGRYLRTTPVVKKGQEPGVKKGHTIEKKDTNTKEITPLTPQGEVAKATGTEPEFTFWTEKTGTHIRGKFDENIKAAHRLRAKLTPAEFVRAVETIRIVRADAHAGRFLHVIGNYIQLEKNLEAIEAYRAGLEDRPGFDRVTTPAKRKVTTL